MLGRGDRPEPADEVELVALLPGRLRRLTASEGERVDRIEGEGYAGMLRPEIERIDRLARVAPRRPTEDHIAGQILVEPAEPVGSPGAEARLRLVEPVAAGVDLVLGGVVVVGRPHVAYETELVDHARQLRPPVADLDAAAAAGGEADLHRIDDRIDVADIDLLGRHRSKALPMERRVDRIVKRRLVVGLAGVVVERGLRIERLDVAVAPRQKHPDHRLGPRGGRRRQGRLPVTQQRLQRQRAEPKPEACPRAGRQQPAPRQPSVICKVGHDHGSSVSGWRRSRCG